MKTLKRISPKSLGRIMGIMYAIFGFIMGLVVMVITLVSPAEELEVGGYVFGVAAPIFFTLIYALMGWIGGYVGAWIYNFVAKKSGGIQFDIE